MRIAGLTKTRGDSARIDRHEYFSDSGQRFEGADSLAGKDYPMSLGNTSVTGIIGSITIGIASALTFRADPLAVDSNARRVGEYSFKVDEVVVSPISSGDSRSEHLGRTAEQTLRLKVELLELGRTFLQTIPGYTAQLRKQEVVHGKLLDEQTIFLKCRHQPFSVYLLWLTGDAGQEVLYVEGANNGKLLAHDGGWKSRLPAFSLSPECALALHDSRYPVTAAGLLGLMEIMEEIHRHDLDNSTFASCHLNTECDFNGRACFEFTTRYKNHAVSPRYRKSITRIDREWNVPLDTQHFEWPKDRCAVSESEVDELTLVESYQFTEVDFDYEPHELDFDRSNPEYRFR
jgi:hypothetical protein